MDNNDNFKKKPKAAPRVRAKKESKTSSELSDGSSLDIKTILKAALQAHSENHQRRTVSDTDALVATIEEFLSAFLIIGYNFQKPLELMGYYNLINKYFERESLLINNIL